MNRVNRAKKRIIRSNGNTRLHISNLHPNIINSELKVDTIDIEYI
jgi:hypothetical protein